MQKESPLIGIVIVTYNSSEYIKECIDSLLKNTYKTKKIVVVDNASQDKTIFILQKYKKKISIIKNKKNLGFAAGNNIAIKFLLERRCKYILLLNGDTVVHTDLIASLFHRLKSNNKLGIVSSTIVYYESPKKIWFAGGVFNRTFCFTRHVNLDKHVLFARSGLTDFVSGCCMMVRSEVFVDVGLFDERTFLYFEDAFFCYKAKLKGYESYIVKQALVKHRVSSSSGIKGTNHMSCTRSYHFARNPFLFIKNEKVFFYQVSQLFGQLCIRLPYYLFKMCREKQIGSVRCYLFGLRHGLIFFLFSKLSKYDA